MVGAERTRLAGGLVIFWLVACGRAPSPSPTPPTDISISIAPVLGPLPDGGTSRIGLRLVTSLGLVDGTPIEASIDTGSSGIQLLASMLPDSVLAALGKTSTTIEVTYPASGIKADGYVASAMVRFGDAGSSSPIPVAVFDQLSCVPGSNCPADAGSLEPFLFGGLPCLLGLGMRSSGIAGVGNPIAQFPGSPAFVVEAPTFGSDGGRLRIAPTSDEIAGYRVFQLPGDAGGPPLQNGVPTWNDLALPSCVDDLTTSAEYCAGALLDTGTPVVEVDWSGQGGVTELPGGSRMEVDMGPDGGSLGQFSLTVGSPPQLGFDAFFLAPPLQNIGQLVILGLPVFSRYDVLFDQAQGRIGLLAH